MKITIIINVIIFIRYDNNYEQYMENVIPSYKTMGKFSSLCPLSLHALWE